MGKRSKSVFTTKKLSQTGGLEAKPTPEQTMWNNTYTTIPKIIPQASATPDVPTETVFGNIKTGIKTTWIPTEQESSILYAMEKQKRLEQENPANVSPTMRIYDEGVEVTLKLQKQLDEQKIRQQQQAQMALDFQNRTHEQQLTEFIETRLEAERSEDTGTNFTQYVSELGDQKLNEMKVNPQVIFQAAGLDTIEEMKAAGVSDRIINMRIQSGIDRDATPTETVTVSNTNPPSNDTNVNFTGLSDDPIFYYKDQNTTTLYQGTENLVFNPQDAQNQNEVVTNQAVSQVNYEGSGSSTHQPKHTSTHEVIATEKAGLAKIWHENPALVSAVGIGIMVLGS